MAKTKSVIEGETLITPTEEVANKFVPQKWERWIINITMANRPSTHPIGRTGTEGYPTSVQCMECVGHSVASEEKIDIELRQLDFRLAGTPNHHVWWFKEGAVESGKRIAADMIWEPIYNRGQVVDYKAKLKMDV